MNRGNDPDDASRTTLEQVKEADGDGGTPGTATHVERATHFCELEGRHLTTGPDDAYCWRHREEPEP